jgi:hypothetical protein
MKKTLTNIAIGGGVLLTCAIIAGNWSITTQAFNLIGAVVRGAGSITLIVLGQGDSVMKSYQNSSRPIRGNFGDDGSGDGKYIGIDQLEVETEGK